jgi:hypothetical protein
VYESKQWTEKYSMYIVYQMGTKLESTFMNHRFVNTVLFLSSK